MAESRYARLFISIALPGAVREQLSNTQAGLRDMLAAEDARWTRPELFHLTLRFLGDVEVTRVEALSDALRGACLGHPPLRLRAHGIGCFPHLRHPKVLWVGVTDEAGRLARLQEAVELATKDFTPESRETRFSGHVTLARFKGLGRSQVEKLEQFAIPLQRQCLGEWTARSLELMRSELSSQGARHTVVASIALPNDKVNLA